MRPLVLAEEDGGASRERELPAAAEEQESARLNSTTLYSYLCVARYYTISKYKVARYLRKVALIL